MENDNYELSQLDLHNIYMCLSVSETTEFDTDEFINSVYTKIEEIYDKSYLQTSSEIILQNDVEINIKLATLIKAILLEQKSHKKELAYIFLGYCSYFDLDEAVVFKKLQDKLQRAIKTSTQYICGSTVFGRAQRKAQDNPNVVITSIFNL